MSLLCLAHHAVCLWSSPRRWPRGATNSLQIRRKCAHFLPRWPSLIRQIRYGSLVSCIILSQYPSTIALWYCYSIRVRRRLRHDTLPHVCVSDLAWGCVRTTLWHHSHKWLDFLWFFFEKSSSNVWEKYWLTKDWRGDLWIHSTIQVKLTLKSPSRKFASKKSFDLTSKNRLRLSLATGVRSPLQFGATRNSHEFSSTVCCSHLRWRGEAQRGWEKGAFQISWKSEKLSWSSWPGDPSQ